MKKNRKQHTACGEHGSGVVRYRVSHHRCVAALGRGTLNSNKIEFRKLKVALLGDELRRAIADKREVRRRVGELEKDVAALKTNGRKTAIGISDQTYVEKTWFAH